MSHTVLHTFVVLAYRDSSYLEECLASLRRQTVHSNILIATSTPSVFLTAVAEKYRLPLLVNAHSAGIAADWSFAYRQGQTPYLTLAHQDDVYLPRYTERCLSVAERYPNALMAFTDYGELAHGQPRRANLLVRTKRLMLWPYYAVKPNLATPWLKTLLLSAGNPVCCPTVMYHTDTIGAFEFDAAFAMNLDWDAWLRLARRKGDFLYLREQLVMRRIHPTSESTQTLRNHTRQREDQVLFDRLWPAPVAKALFALYARAYESNDVKA